MTRQVAVVTGSASGIGAAIARAFSADGVAVVLNSVRSVDAGQALADELGEAVYVQADIASDGAGQVLVAAAEKRWGRLDYLVNNASTTVTVPHKNLEGITNADWDRILGTNVVGTWSVSRAAVPLIRASGGGSITMITSLAGLRPVGSSIPYAVSKSAMAHLSVLLANALGPDIRVNAIAPGLIDTPWTEVGFDAIRRSVEQRAPLHRAGQPEEVAQLCLALARSTYVTGQVVAVDGGLQWR